MRGKQEHSSQPTPKPHEQGHAQGRPREKDDGAAQVANGIGCRIGGRVDTTATGQKKAECGRTAPKHGRREKRTPWAAGKGEQDAGTAQGPQRAAKYA